MVSAHRATRRGTDYNQIFFADEGAPLFDETTPLVMEIRATTYYREALLSSSYQLFLCSRASAYFRPFRLTAILYTAKDRRQSLCR
ncbi:hypothetical protein GCM10007052_12130 [Halioglobus japonicus]|nr:hypothetical protein GCM10007052_12130 [Halioglobus japonicus]